MSDNIYRITDAKIGYEIIKANGGSAKYIELEKGTHELENVIDEAIEAMMDWLLPYLS